MIDPTSYLMTAGDKHQPRIIFILQGCIYTLSVSEARKAQSSLSRASGWRCLKVNISSVRVSEAATGTLSKCLRLSWKSMASVAERRSLSEVSDQEHTPNTIRVSFQPSCI
ncbi:hypothetical protein ILYODFUR_018345 [Ilyodon furcidens]|uniref:Uncharacterized protein n=1 Tax=Ilyodon furcidens TaxID=33524 RepID=A0ABV0SNI0_9TELE